MPDPVVTRCPACRHLVTVPDEFLGKTVTCLQCKAAFAAPAANPDGTFSPPVLLRPGRSKVPPFLFVPMIGLLLLGIAGVLVNGYLATVFNSEPEAAATFARWLYRQQLVETPPDEAKLPANAPADEVQKRDAKREAFAADQEEKLNAAAAAAGPVFAKVQWPFALVSLGVLAGGVAFAARRAYWLAFVGCGLAVLNLNHACCVPGFVVGVWGFLALISEDGRRFFGRG